MAREVGDLWPQASGSSALGAEMTNGGFTGEIRPFATIHTSSGVFHSSTRGTSGIIRFETNSKDNIFNTFAGEGFDFSFDGGKNYPLEIGKAAGAPLSVDIGVLYGDLRIYSSGQSSWTTVNGGFVFQGNNGPCALTAFGGGNLNGDIILLAQQQVQLTAFNSGILEYRFGPHQAWYEKLTHSSTGGPFNDGYWPIAHSGQVAAMIGSSSGQGGLQAAYVNGSTITATAALGGAPQVRGNGSYSLFINAKEADHPHILMSGVSDLVANGLSRGALWLQGHTAGVANQLIGGSNPTSYAEAAARSLGIDTLFMFSGSGIVNIRAASGISQFFNQSASTGIDATGIIIPIGSIAAADSHFGVATTSGITVFNSGKYKISYVAVLEKTAGNMAQLINTELRIRDKVGGNFKLIGSDSAAIIRDSTFLKNNTAGGQWVGDIRAGETIQLFCSASDTPYGNNNARGAARKCNIIVEWIGPLSAGGSTRLAV